MNNPTCSCGVTATIHCPIHGDEGTDIGIPISPSSTQEASFQAGCDKNATLRAAPTPAPATSEGQTPRTKAIFAHLDRAFLSDTGYEHRIALREASKNAVQDLETELAAATRRAEEAERERDEALKMCKELNAQATKFQKKS